MRIIAVRPAPVGRVFALTYAIVGLAAFVMYAVSSVTTFILPFGILLGPFYLSINIPLGRSPDLLGNAFSCIGAVLSYTLSGWITGVALTLCLNFIAQKTGGIDAKFVSVATDARPSPTGVPVG
jgi:hypothetical protein